MSISESARNTARRAYETLGRKAQELNQPPLDANYLFVLEVEFENYLRALTEARIRK